MKLELELLEVELLELELLELELLELELLELELLELELLELLELELVVLELLELLVVVGQGNGLYGGTQLRKQNSGQPIRLSGSTCRFLFSKFSSQPLTLPHSHKLRHGIAMELVL